MIRVALVCLVVALGGQSSAETTDSPSAATQEVSRDSSSQLIEQSGVVVVEVAPELDARARAQLQRELAKPGLTFAATRPAGFPAAGANQDLEQNVWACTYDSSRTYAEVYAQFMAWRDAGTDADPRKSILGMLPGYLEATGRTPTFFRPAHVAVMLTPFMAFDRVADSAAGLGLTVVPDSLPPPTFARYLWRRVYLRVDPRLGVFAALDSLRRRAWVRAASPVFLDWGHQLPVLPRVALMKELAVGQLRKLRPLEMTVVVQAGRVDGPEAAVEVARSINPDVDSLGRMCLRIEALDSYQHMKSELEAMHAEVLSHEQSVDQVAVVALVPCKWLAVLIGMTTVTNVHPYPQARTKN